MAMPGNRTRTAIDWILDAALGRQTVQLGLVRSAAVPLHTRRPSGHATSTSPDQPRTAPDVTTAIPAAEGRDL
jgi:hypothetical protein